MKLVLWAACVISAQAKPDGPDSLKTSLDADSGPAGRLMIGDSFHNAKDRIDGNQDTNLRRTKTIYLVFWIMG